MHVLCPHCRSEFEVASGVRDVTCRSCGRPFSLKPEAATLTEHVQPEAAVAEARTVLSPKLRINCVECNKEFMVPWGEETVVCPRCGVSFDTKAGEETEAEPHAATAPSGAPEAGRDVAVADLDWMRTHFEDKYEILDFVSHGGMGAVYRARQKQPSREVALKVMLGGSFATKKHRARFEREAQAVALLRHPAVVPVYEYGEAGGRPYFTMEFVEGTDLRSYVTANRLSREEICRMMVRVCDAIHYAHQHGVIHRDLKPGNVLVDALNRPRILDFGLSRTSVEGEDQLGALTVTGELMGTPRYMSPEQAMGRPRDVDERTDVYALGVMLYELVVGVLPFPIEHARGLRALDLLREAQPLRPSALHQTIQRDLEIILLKAVQKDKEQRYQSAEALAQDLENYLAGRPISARAATLGYRFSKWTWRNRKVLTPVVASVLVITLLTGLFMNRILGLRRSKAELESEMQKFAQYLRRAEGAAAGVEELIAQDNWHDAYQLAVFAPRIFPEEAGAEELPAKVRQAAENTVRGALSAFADLVRAQRYDEASEKARELSVLADAMPYEDLEEEAAAVEPAFAEYCWTDLRAAVDQAYERAEARARIESFIEFLPHNPHAGEAQSLLEGIAAKPVEHFAQQRVRAFRRAMESYDWQQAEGVLDSAQRLLAAGTLGEEAAWREQFTELRRQLDSVIRKETAEKLQQVWPPKGHEGMVKAVEFAADGSFLAVGALGGAVTLYDTSSGRVLRTLEHESGVWRLAISTDGGLLAAGCADGSVTVWSAEDGRLLHRLQGHAQRLNSVGFSPDGALLLSADVEQVLLWDPRSGESAAAGGIRGRGPAAFSPTGELTAIAADTSDLNLWAVSTGELIRTLPCTRKPLRLAFSPDGSVLASAHSPEGDMRVGLWYLADVTGISQLPLAVEKRVGAMAFSPDGRLLATGGLDKRLKLWQVRTGTLVCDLAAESGLACAAFSPDGRLLATGSNDKMLRLWGVPRAQ